MNKLGILIIISSLLILGGGAYFFTRQEKPVNIPTRDQTVYEYFWGNGCPHCAAVQEFFDSWDKIDSVKIIKREVWYDKNNSSIMQDRFNKCDPKPASAQMSVPFMVTPDGKCLTGSTPIINLFKSL
jgi:thiol-disulfide isomerase/thioredoxin